MSSISLSSISSQISSSIFSKIDTNNQGYIDKTQFSSISGDDSDSSSTDSDQAFATLDSDSDGKLTKSELSKGIENLLTSLNSSSVQGQAQGSRPPHKHGDGDGDAGMTKDQMTQMASQTKDTNLSSSLTNLAKNFDAADTNKDGKVSQQEAMAYEESQEKTASTSSTSTSASSSSSSSDVASKKVAELLAKYLA